MMSAVPLAGGQSVERNGHDSVGPSVFGGGCGEQVEVKNAID
jgi:hypothetical protein